MMSTPMTRGRIAYVAYGTQRNFRTYDDRPMPTWAELPPEIQAAWIAAAGAVWDIATIHRTASVSNQDVPPSRRPPRAPTTSA